MGNHLDIAILRALYHYIKLRSKKITLKKIL